MPRVAEPLARARPPRAGRAVRGCTGNTTGAGSAASSSTSCSSRAGSSTLPARCAVTTRYAPGSRPSSLEDRRALLGDVTERERDVRHDVAHEVDLAGGPLALEVPDRRLGRAEQEVAGVVREHAVQLLGHGAVEGAHPGLDMAGRDGRLAGRERAGERRVGVAVHEHELGAKVGQNRLQPREDARRSGRCCSHRRRPARTRAPARRARRRRSATARRRSAGRCGRSPRRCARAAGVRPQPPSRTAGGFQ